MLDWGLLVLRLGIGIMFMAHGMQKVFGFFGGPGISGFSKMLSGLGMVPAVFWAYVGSYTELLGGLLLVLGIGVRGSAALLLIFIATAAIKVHFSKGFFLGKGGFEYTMVIASVCIALILMGAGRFSIFH